MKVLVLNQGYQPMTTISWQKAFCMVYTDRADLVKEYDSLLHSASDVFFVPAVIRIRTYVKLNWGASFSRAAIYHRDGFNCQYCGDRFRIRELTFDHVKPRSKGGVTCWLNIVTACKECNNKKANRTPKQARMPLLRQPYIPSRRISMSWEFHNAPTEWRDFL